MIKIVQFSFTRRWGEVRKRVVGLDGEEWRQALSAWQKTRIMLSYKTSGEPHLRFVLRAFLGSTILSIQINDASGEFPFIIDHADKASFDQLHVCTIHFCFLYSYC